MEGLGGQKREMGKSKSIQTKRSSRDRREKGEGQSKRDLTKERGGKYKANKSGAMSSYEALFYHDIPTVVLERLAKRYTGGHRKYGVEHVNLNWKTGLNDPKYIADRYNHAMQHMLDLKRFKNKTDDDAGGALWNIAFVIVAEHYFPEAFAEAFCQDELVGLEAKLHQEKLRNKK